MLTISNGRIWQGADYGQLDQDITSEVIRHGVSGHILMPLIEGVLRHSTYPKIAEDISSFLLANFEIRLREEK